MATQKPLVLINGQLQQLSAADAFLPAVIGQDASNRFVTDAEKTAWNAKASIDSPVFNGIPRAAGGLAIGVDSDLYIYESGTNALSIRYGAPGSYKYATFGADGNVSLSGNTVLHSSNYNSYAPTLTGTGASGAWGINVTGNAATVTNGVYTNTAQTITGVKTFSNGLITGDTQGYPDYSVLLDFSADAAGTWRKLVTATLVNNTYSSIGFKVDVVDPRANHATTGAIHARTESYYVACIRTDNLTLNTPDACYVSGPSNRIRAVKTAQGVYEIQIQNEAQWREYRVDICVYAVNYSHNIVYHAGVSCTAGIAQYNASVSTTQTDFFQNVSARTLKSTVATGAAPLEVTSTTAVTNLNADLLDGQHGSYYQNAGSLNAGTLPDARLPSRLGALCQSVGDWNAAVSNGYYMANPGTNAPTGTGWYIGHVLAHTDRWVTQTVWQFNDNSDGDTETWRRESTDGGSSAVWGPWVRVWQTQSELDARYARMGVYQNFNSGLATEYGLPASTSMAAHAAGVAGPEVRSQGTGATAGAAMMTFHRPSSYAAFLGLDTDNMWKVGGWSMGAVAYKLWHEGSDGPGSGLDADLLDGQQGSYYQNASNLNAGTLPAARLPTDSDRTRKITISTAQPTGGSDGDLWFVYAG